MEAVPLGPLGPTPLSNADQSRENGADAVTAEPEFPFTIDELRKLCEEAIARGQACERARAAAWKRWFSKYAMVVAVPVLLVSGVAVWCLLLTG